MWRCVSTRDCTQIGISKPQRIDLPFGHWISMRSPRSINVSMAKHRPLPAYGSSSPGQIQRIWVLVDIGTGETNVILALCVCGGLLSKTRTARCHGTINGVRSSQHTLLGRAGSTIWILVIIYSHPIDGGSCSGGWAILAKTATSQSSCMRARRCMSKVVTGSPHGCEYREEMQTSKKELLKRK